MVTSTTSLVLILPGSEGDVPQPPLPVARGGSLSASSKELQVSRLAGTSHFETSHNTRQEARMTVSKFRHRLQNL